MSRLDELRARQVYDITSKKGLAGELYSTRLDNSFSTTTASLVFNHGTESSTVEDLVKINGENSVFARGKINGKTWIEHYNEGKIYDIQEVGPEFFERNGYFEDDFMNTFFKKDKEILAMDHAGKVEEMKKYLEVNPEAVIATRFPRTKDSSDSILYTFLKTYKLS